MIKVKDVKVKNMRGDWIAPTDRNKASSLIRKKKAKVISKEPLIIQLLIPAGETNISSSPMIKTFFSGAMILALMAFAPQDFSINDYKAIKSAYALTVFDPSNYNANLETKLQAIKQTAQQAQQISNELKNLAKLNSATSNKTGEMIRQSLSDLNAIRRSVNAIGSDYETIMNEFDDLSPDYSKWNGVSAADYAKQVDRVRTAWAKAVEQSVKSGTIASAENQERVTDGIDLLLDASQNAEGAMGALQAANQIAAITVSELQKMEAIMVDSQRTQNLYFQKMIDSEERSKKIAEEFNEVDPDIKDSQIVNYKGDIPKFKEYSS